jgi:hypothetical protein
MIGVLRSMSERDLPIYSNSFLYTRHFKQTLKCIVLYICVLGKPGGTKLEMLGRRDEDPYFSLSTSIADRHFDTTVAMVGRFLASTAQQASAISQYSAYEIFSGDHLGSFGGRS